MTISWSYLVEPASDDPTQPTDLALDPDTWDLEIPPRLIRGAEAVAQRLMVRLRWIKGEWYLDQNQGVPWFEILLGQKNPDVRLVEGIIRQAILSTPGVTSVQEISVTYDPTTRHASLAFVATTTDSARLEYQSDNPLTLPL